MMLQHSAEMPACLWLAEHCRAIAGRPGSALQFGWKCSTEGLLVCRVVSEWSFQKDGVDAAMKDLANETRGAQTDDRDTFLGIGQKRYPTTASLPHAALLFHILRCCACQLTACVTV